MGIPALRSSQDEPLRRGESGDEKYRVMMMAKFRSS